MDKDNDKALLVAAGLKTVRIVCTKAENNKGESRGTRTSACFLGVRRWVGHHVFGGGGL